MTAHLHRVFVPGCYRCELSKDELPSGPDSSATDRDAPAAPVDTPPDRCPRCKYINLHPDTWAQRTVDADRLIREAIDQLNPPAYFGPGSWWERAHDWLEAAGGDSGDEDVTRVQAGQDPGASRYDTGPEPPATYTDAVLAVLRDAPEGGMDAAEISAAIRDRWPDAFPLGPFTDLAVGVSHTPGDETARGETP